MERHLMPVKWYADNIKREIAKAKRKALQNCGKAVAKEAKALAPVGIEEKFVKPGAKQWTGRIPGTLKKSIRYAMVKKGTKVQVIAGGRSAKYLTAFYAPFVEFGTVDMIAQPYLRPALEKSHAAIEAEFNNWI